MEQFSMQFQLNDLPYVRISSQKAFKCDAPGYLISIKVSISISISN